jgi:hypothetical protein
MDSRFIRIWSPNSFFNFDKLNASLLTLTKSARVALWAHFARATFFIHRRGFAALGAQVPSLHGWNSGLSDEEILEKLLKLNLKRS